MKNTRERYHIAIIGVIVALMAMVCFGSSVFAAADTTSASKSAAQTVYTYEDDTMKVTATLSDATAIPTGSTLKVEALTDQTTDENIKSLYTDAKSMMDNQSKNEKYTLDGFAAYNIYFKKDDNTYVPSTGTMTLDVTYKTANAPAAYTKSTDANKAVIVYQKTQIKDNLGNSTYVLSNLGTAKDADNNDIISQKTLDESGNVTALTFKEGTYLPVILAWTENNAQAAANGVVTPAPTTEPTTTVTPAPTAEPTVTPAPTAAADNTTTPAVDNNNNTNDTTNKDNYTLGDDKTTNEALVATAQADESALTDNTAKGVISTDASGNKIKTYTYKGDDVTVTVTADDTSALPDNAVMSVTPVTVSADLQTKLASESVQPAAAYDISFKSGSVEVEPAIAVKVTITPNNVEVGENTEVYHIADDGSLNNVYAQVDENTKLTFNSMCFSTYVITTNDASANNNRLDDWNSTDSVVEFTEVAPIVIGGTGEDSSNGMASVIDTGLQIAAKTAKEQVNNFSSFLITTVQAAESTLTGSGSSSVDTSNDTDGLYTNKSVSANSDGTWDINLEAYTTGTVKTTTSGVPADIVLTIDTSGSMYFTMGTSYSYSQLDTTKPDYYYRLGANDQYTDYTNALRYRNNQWQIFNGSSWVNLSQYDYWYNYRQYYVIRMSALKEAASSFIDQVYTDATNTTEHSGQIVNHRIAITSFAENTGVNVSGFLDVSNPANVTTLKTAISKLTPGGGTDTAGGMYRAWQYFYNDTPPSGTRSKVSVLFTDGEPTFHLNSKLTGYAGTGYSFDSTGADQAITYANNMKNGKDKSGNKIGASVFTIGIFGGADPTSISSDANKFMNYVSSNYPSATKMSSGGTGKNNGFYLATDDADALSSIFKKISESVSHPTVILDSTTVLKDVISDYFKLDGDASVVSVKTAAYTGKDESGNRTFSSTTTDISSDVTVTVDGQKVSVTGYDYSNHYVVDSSGTVPTSGEKIIVTLKVKRQPWYYGGNATPTNNSDSGIYNSDGTTTYVKFHEPSADVPILYEVGAQDESIYLTQNATASDIAKLGTDGDLNYTPDGTNNKYVNITYTLVDKDGKTVTDSSGNSITTTVAAGTPLPTGGLFNSQQISGLTDNTTYTVKAVVSSVNEPSKEDGSTSGVDNLEKSAKGTVYVFKPTVKAKDSTIFLGDMETLGADNSIASFNWTNSKTTNKPDGDAPALNYTFEDTNKVAATTVSPSTDTDYKIATVKIGDTDITSNTTIQNAGTVDNFTVHVVKGQILLTKTINQQYSGIQAIKANQTFVFKIQKQDIEGGPTTATFYETINFDANAGNLTGERLISGLSKGIYTITEETSWSPKYSLDNSTSNGVVVKVGYKDPTSNDYIALEDLGNNGYSAATATSGPSYGTFDPTDNSNSKTIDTGRHSYSEIGVTGHHATVGFKNNIDSNWNWLSDTAAAINVFNQN